MGSRYGFLTCFLLLAIVSSSQGLQLTMDRTPGQPICATLRCTNDVTPDGNIFSTTSISIYDVTQPGTKVKVASVSSSGADLVIDPSKISDISGSGSLSRYNADVSLTFRNENDCLSGSFQCEIEVVNMNGQIDSLNVVAAPGNQNNGCSCCSVLTYQLSKLTARFDDLERETANLRLNHTVLENELVLLKTQNYALTGKVDVLTNWISNNQNTAAPSLPATIIVTGPPHVQGACSKGATHSTSRDKFWLWGTVLALCDTETDGGGWVIIQRRTKGDMDFFKNWNDYKVGFGNPDTDFWIGNEVIHNLTAQGYNELRIDMELEGRKYFAHYSIFNVDNELLNYKLTVSGYSGSAGDSLTYHNGMSFTTTDQDHDKDFNNCATHHTSAWWYNTCYTANLNGVWGKNAEGGIVWAGIAKDKSLSFTEMKVRHI